MRNKITAGLLAILFGGFGIHRFYLGRIPTGLLYLVFCWTFIPAILGIFEACLLFGMSDQEFNYKYNSEPEKRFPIERKPQPWETGGTNK